MYIIRDLILQSIANDFKKHLGSEIYVTFFEAYIKPFLNPYLNNFSKHGPFEHHGSVLPHENSGILYLEKCKLHYLK